MKEELLIKLVEMLVSDKKTEPETGPKTEYPIGNKIIIRGYNAGVLFGTLVSVYLDEKGNRVYRLKDSRRLWYWSANRGISLEDVSQYGINQQKSKITSVVPLIDVTDTQVSLLIQCSKESIKSIEEAPVYQP